MDRRSKLLLLTAFVVALMSMRGGLAEAALTKDYYRQSCPNVESIVRTAVKKKIAETVVTMPATLRLFFHDCFGEGCDAATLIHLPGGDAEKDAPDNVSLAGDGFDTVIRAKEAVEAECPGVVSCADVLAIAARDVVALAGGPEWPVELGRLDGLVSKASLVAGHLPGPDDRLAKLLSLFRKNNLTVVDFVALCGAHTIGFAHCSRFAKRLYRFNATHQTDPTFNPEYAKQLKVACPPNVGPTIAVNMDPVTPITFDTMYYSNLQIGLGLFSSDQMLFSNKKTRPLVAKFAQDKAAFFKSFATAMVKLGRLGVKTGKDGNIRRHCSAFNQ